MIKYGLKARHDDLDFIYSLKPELIEFHFSNQDIDLKLNGKHFNCYLAVHLPEYWQSQLVDPASFDEKLRTFTVEMYNQALDRIRYMRHWFKNGRKPIVIMHPGAWSNNPVPEQNNKITKYTQLFKSIEELNKEGLEFTIENLPPFPWYYGGRWYTKIGVTPQSMKFINMITGLGLTFDICHAALWANTQTGDTQEILENYFFLLKNKIEHIHISDAKGDDGEGLQINEGVVNWQHFLPLLQDFDGFIVPEVWFGHKNAAKGFKECINLLNEHWHKIMDNGVMKSG